MLVPQGEQGKMIVVSVEILLVFHLDLRLPGQRIWVTVVQYDVSI